MKIVGIIIMLFAFTAVAYYTYPEMKLPAGIQIDKLIVYKSKRELLAFFGETLVKRYRVSLSNQPIGAKEFQDDNKTPEGKYFINDKSRYSDYHKNLSISYPSAKHRIQAAKLGRKPGGDVKIHGLKNQFGFIGRFQRLYDWTRGCIALTDEEIDELYDAVKIGTPIIIYP
jgi:murein L,D-transpeptidase YafK